MNSVTNPITTKRISLELDGNNDNDDRFSKDSVITNDTVGTKESISSNNTNWHQDRPLFYTYYSILHDHNVLSLR